jgi:hypothetical protein
VSIAKALLPNPAMIKQAVQDPSGTIRGAAELASLGDPVANTMRGINLVQGKGFSLYDTDMSDVEQAAELAGLIPSGKVVRAPFFLFHVTISITIPSKPRITILSLDPHC